MSSLRPILLSLASYLALGGLEEVSALLIYAESIADLEGAADIRPEFISEAIQYRSLDRQLWA